MPVTFYIWSLQFHYCYCSDKSVVLTFMWKKSNCRFSQRERESERERERERERCASGKLQNVHLNPDNIWGISFKSYLANQEKLICILGLERRIQADAWTGLIWSSMISTSLILSQGDDTFNCAAMPRTWIH
jgi:hypothetical protein